MGHAQVAAVFEGVSPNFHRPVKNLRNVSSSDRFLLNLSGEHKESS